MKWWNTVGGWRKRLAGDWRGEQWACMRTAVLFIRSLSRSSQFFLKKTYSARSRGERKNAYFLHWNASCVEQLSLSRIQLIVSIQDLCAMHIRHIAPHSRRYSFIARGFRKYLHWNDRWIFQFLPDKDPRVRLCNPQQSLGQHLTTTCHVCVSVCLSSADCLRQTLVSLAGALHRDLSQNLHTSTCQVRLPFYCSGIASRQGAMRWA